MAAHSSSPERLRETEVARKRSWAIKESVPGAVATGSQLARRPRWLGRDPVATAPGTDSLTRSPTDLTTKQSTRSRVITNQQPEVAGQFQYATILVKTESIIHEVTQNLAKKALVFEALHLD